MTSLRFLVPSVLLGIPFAAHAQAGPPDWWEDRDVTSGNSPNNHAPASVGQLKWMARNAWEEMEAKVPGGAGFALEDVVPVKPASPDAAWYEAQKTMLNLGQLKHVAAPFYERLDFLAPGWVAGEFERNGLTSWPFTVPWDPSTSAAQNHLPAVIGQLKQVFSLRFDESHDSDAIPDLLEYIYYGDTSGDGTTTDQDGDGLTDAEEMTAGTDMDNPDTDGDGIADGDDNDPLTPESLPQSTASLVVWTPLED